MHHHKFNKGSCEFTMYQLAVPKLTPFVRPIRAKFTFLDMGLT